MLSNLPHVWYLYLYGLYLPTYLPTPLIVRRCQVEGGVWVFVDEYVLYNTIHMYICRYLHIFELRSVLNIKLLLPFLFAWISGC